MCVYSMVYMTKHYTERIGLLYNTSRKVYNRFTKIEK